MPHVIYNQQSIPMTVIRRPEATVYAQIDVTKRIPPCLQTLSPPHPSTFQAMHHPHLPPYIPRPIREEQTMHDNTINSESPLINPRESSVSSDKKVFTNIDHFFYILGTPTFIRSKLYETAYNHLVPTTSFGDGNTFLTDLNQSRMDLDSKRKFKEVFFLWMLPFNVNKSVYRTRFFTNKKEHV